MKKSSLKHTKSPLTKAKSKEETSPNSIIKKHTEQDPLANSQLISCDLAKSQQSFRTTSSPNMSPTRSKSQILIARKSAKRNSTIISKQQLGQMHERSVIKLLGLNLEAVCPKPGHDKNKMLFICQYPECQADSKLGCAYCQLEQHGDHPTHNMEIQSFCRIFDEKYKEFQDQSRQILNPPDMKKQIKDHFEYIKQSVIEKLQQIEDSVTEAITQHLAYEAVHYPLIDHIEQLGKKNIFEMTQLELQESIEFIQGKHINEIVTMTFNANTYIQEKTQQADQAWEQFVNQLEFDLMSALGDNCEMFFMDYNSPDYATIRLQKQEQKKLRIEQQSQPYKEVISQVVKQQQAEEQRKAEMIRLKQQIEQTKKQEEIAKKIEMEIKQKELQKQKELEAENEERDKVLKTFPHLVYDQDCVHRPHCNTIPIFSCCNKAYPCAQCHGYKSHPPRISIPSYRYCMKCLEIYLVIYPTNQPVNCLKCV